MGQVVQMVEKRFIDDLRFKRLAWLNIIGLPIHLRSQENYINSGDLEFDDEDADEENEAGDDCEDEEMGFLPRGKKRMRMWNYKKRERKR
ncbi:hypothetical protein L2E82_13591 [Cichorium intybus]|uniref:Uncharacterized protein n=1 Tax=Cichorium intybus TaxID=13427 RepID=A0ACB9EY47_CICIN|nr:hypothetical protein L2E82_13591 [Cichorium intybus]